MYKINMSLVVTKVDLPKKETATKKKQPAVKVSKQEATETQAQAEPEKNRDEPDKNQSEPDAVQTQTEADPNESRTGQAETETQVQSEAEMDQGEDQREMKQENQTVFGWNDDTDYVHESGKLNEEKMHDKMKQVDVSLLAAKNFSFMDKLTNRLLVIDAETDTCSMDTDAAEVGEENQAPPGGEQRGSIVEVGQEGTAMADLLSSEVSVAQNYVFLNQMFGVCSS